MTLASAPIFTPPQALPRGPHALSREEVAASQRARLMAAIPDVVAERGYAAATIAEISRRAGVSPKTFYEHFEDKLDCYLAAYDEFARVLLARIGGELDADAPWDEFVTAALTAYLGTLEREPVVARAFLVEIDAAGAVARARRRAAYIQFAALIRTRHELTRRLDPTLGPLPERAYLGLVHGVRALVCDALEADPRARLLDLAADIRTWLTATISGAGSDRLKGAAPG
jgi:AcrR family transcriptional regulator